MTPEEEYKSLLQSGMFWEFFPNLTGSWDSDKVWFAQMLDDKRNESNTDG